MEGSKEKMISEILKLANNCDSLDDFYGKVFGEITKMLKCQSGFILTEEDDYLSLAIARGASPAIWRVPPFKTGKGIIGKLAEGNTRILKNLQQLELGQYFDKSLKSVLVSPIVRRGNLLGFMGFLKTEFSQSEIKKIEELSDLVAMISFSYKASEVYSQNSKIKNELRVVGDMLKKLSYSLDHPQMITDLLQTAAKITNSQRAALAVYEKNDNSLEIQPAAFNLSGQEAKFLKVNHDEKLGGAAFCKGTIQILNRLDQEHTDYFQKARLTIKSMVAVPLKMKSQSVGVLYLFSENEGNYRGLDRILLEKVAALVAAALSHFQANQSHKNVLALKKAIFESINIGICLLDKDGKILLFNRAAENLTGYHADEIKGKKLDSFFNISELQNSEKPIELKKKNGQILKSSLSKIGLKNSENKEIGSLISFKDVEDELLFKEAQENIFDTTNQLKTPATGIKTLIEMILAGATGEINQKTRNVLEEAKVATEKLKNVVENIFSTSEIERGNISVRAKKIDFARLVKKVISNYRFEAEEKGIDLSLKINQPFYIKADSEKTKQVLDNLINNAVKFTKKGRIIITAQKRGDLAEINVTDTGIGMTKMQVKNLFSQYYRIKSPETANIPGAGLGLWAAKKLVEAQNGKISVISEKDFGSTFKINLPAGN